MPSCATPARRSCSRPRSSTTSRRATTRSPSAIPTACRSRWRTAGTTCPTWPTPSRCKVPGHGVTLGGYFFKPQAGKPPYPAVILLHGFAGHAHNMAGWRGCTAANGYAALALSLRGWLGSEGESDQGLRQPLDVLAAIDWLAKRPLVDRERIAAGRRLDGRPGGAAGRRAQAADPRRRLLLRRRPTWRAGARPTPSCATISTICAGPRACRCARRSCAWRRSTRRCC